MPIYEFYCPECKAKFEELCSMGTKSLPCPQCGYIKTDRQISSFGIGGNGTSNSSASGCSSCHGGHCNSCH